MQAKIYISKEAMATVNAIKDLDYYDRVSLSDYEATDFTSSPGYYLNTNALDLAELPDDANVAIHLTPADAETYNHHVSIPTILRGVIFSGAPNLPHGCGKKLGYWSPLAPTIHHRGAVYYQNVLNAYCVSLTDTDEESDLVNADGAGGAVDTLLSDGVVIVVTGLAAMAAKLAPGQYVAVSISIDTAMLGIELDGFMSSQEYVADPAQKSETLFLRAADILASPDANHIVISALRTDLSGYGYTY
ncbi:hypothetical protein ACFDR9_003070 [Janthinobacterium sp. CG_23.3]|uniref:hypothetical protein n=1 Tax=Janthinobacterium sp. CG_23.3 TaxID=3349634 RepID=UPI0038D44F11